jgi:pyruvate,water dikinase
MKPDHSILALKDIPLRQPAEVGGKAYNLGRLAACGAPVPYGFVISTAAWQEFALIPDVDRALKAFISTSSEKNYKHLRAAILQTPLPIDLEKELYRCWEKFQGHKFVCRSSAAHEDGSQHSYAGHYATWLNLSSFAQLVRAVKLCWISLFSTGKDTYLADAPLESSGMAVIVQKMVVPKSSGVMFSLVESPLGSGIGIEAVYGLGEGLVSGLLQPDRYLLDSTNGELKFKQIPLKPAMLFPNLTGKQLSYGDECIVGGYTHHVIREEKFSHTLAVLLHESWHEREILIAAEQAQLYSWATRIEKSFGTPQDIEWSIDENDQIQILQSRPITAPVWWNLQEQIEDDSLNELTGNSASTGIASGYVHLLNAEDSGKDFREGEVLVTFQTFPKWFFAMSRAAAIVTQTGGMLCHAAIVARELGKPCVTGVPNILERCKNGMLITVNGTHGKVRLNSQTQADETAEHSETTPDDQEYWDIPGDSLPGSVPKHVNPIAALHWTLMETGPDDDPLTGFQALFPEAILGKCRVLDSKALPEIQVAPDLAQTEWGSKIAHFIEDVFEDQVSELSSRRAQE